MPLVTRTGTYLACPAKLTIEEKPGKCPRAVILFSVFSFRHGGVWTDVPSDELITGFFTLFNKDGAPNEINLRALRDALGWDGQSFASLTNTDWSTTEVQIVVGNHEHNGQTSLEVKYLNPRDYAGKGAGGQSDPQVVQSLEQKYGAVLRTLFKSSNGTPTKPIITPASIDPAERAKTSAWKTFVAKTPEFDDAKRAESFKSVCAEANPGRDLKTLSPEEWQKTERVITERYSPALDAAIPF